MKLQDFKKQGVAEECCVIGTRNAIRAMRGSLDCCKHYVITDYNRANVGAATILLHAVDKDTFSSHAHIKTIHDNDAWEGRYDIDTNRIVELKDNRNNHITGRVGAEVDRFDWGNNHRSVHVNNATLLSSVGGSFAFNGITITESSYLDVRNATGAMLNSQFTSGANVYLNGATVTTFRHSFFKSNCNVNLNNQTNITIDASTFGGSASVSRTGGTSFIANNSNFLSGAYVLQQNGTMRFERATISSYGYVRQNNNSNLFLYYASVTDYARMFQYATSGNYYFYYSNLRGGSYFYQNLTTGNKRFYYFNMNSYGYYRDTSSSDTLNMYYTTIDSYGRFYRTSNTGTSLVYYSNFHTVCYTDIRTTNGARIYGSTFSNAANTRLTTADTSYIYYSTFSSGALTTVTNSRFYSYMSSYSSRSQVSATQGGYKRLYYSEFKSFSRLTLTGATTQTIQRVTMGSNAGINSQFNINWCVLLGSFTQTLTAVNTNRHRGFGQNTLI